MFEQLGLIGCGLMGGSFALALKQAGYVKRVVGYSKSPSTTEKARQKGVIDIAAPSALQAVSGSDIVLIAIPVAATEATFKSIKHLVGPDTLVMDVGSTKQDVVLAAKRALRDQFGSFVPAHPIAGKELSGVEHADPGLYRDKHVILTPTELTQSTHVERAVKVWEALGARVLRMSAQQHDSAFAAVSHLPHLLAFAFIRGLLGQAEGSEWLHLAGPGFRDFTRIAASDAKMWRDILLTNKVEVLAQLEHFRQSLNDLELMIRDDLGDSLQANVETVSGVRARWRMAARDALE